MNMKGFKKFLISLGLGAMLTFGMATAASASTISAQLIPEKENNERETAIPVISGNQESQATEAAMSSESGNPQQTAADLSSVSLKWNSVPGAARYSIEIKSYSSNSAYKVLGNVKGTSVRINKLKSGITYKVRIKAISSSGSAIRSFQPVNCSTLYEKAEIKSSYETSKGYTFNMKLMNPSDSITGYKVVYADYASRKKITKYFNTRYSFTLPMKRNTFYKVNIYPYLTLNNKRFVSPKATSRYIAMSPLLSKAGNTQNSMTVKWNKVAGANHYSIYIQYPGSKTYKKVKTTSALSYKLQGMKLGSEYKIRVTANKVVGRTTWRSAYKTYRLRLALV